MSAFFYILLGVVIKELWSYIRRYFIGIKLESIKRRRKVIDDIKKLVSNFVNELYNSIMCVNKFPELDVNKFINIVNNMASIRSEIVDINTIHLFEIKGVAKDSLKNINRDANNSIKILRIFFELYQEIMKGERQVDMSIKKYTAKGLHRLRARIFINIMLLDFDYNDNYAKYRRIYRKVINYLKTECSSHNERLKKIYEKIKRQILGQSIKM